MNIAIAADHGGFELKEILIKHYAKQNLILKDLGTYSEESVDYPDISKKWQMKSFLKSRIWESLFAERESAFLLPLTAIKESAPQFYIILMWHAWQKSIIMQILQFSGEE